jgi:excisionase family DNA binding protein
MQLKDAPEPFTLTVRSFTERTGVGVTTTYRLIADGSIQATNVGGRRLIFWQSYLDYLSRTECRMTHIHPATLAAEIVVLCNEATARGEHLAREKIYSIMRSRHPGVTVSNLNLAFPRAAEQLREDAARWKREADALSRNK